MPFDPHTFPSEVPAPITVLDFTVAEFLDFALSKPADEEYDYLNVAECACGQFARHLGIDSKDDRRPMVEARLTRPAGERPRTWGALAKRLQALSA